MHYRLILYIFLILLQLMSNSAFASYQHLHNPITDTLVLIENVHYKQISLPFSIIKIKNLPTKIIYKTYKMVSKTKKTNNKIKISKRNNKTRKTNKKSKIKDIKNKIVINKKT